MCVLPDFPLFSSCVRAVEGALIRIIFLVCLVSLFCTEGHLPPPFVSQRTPSLLGGHPQKKGGKKIIHLITFLGGPEKAKFLETCVDVHCGAVVA